MGYHHRLPGVCNHLASRIGGECGRPDEGTWTPLYDVTRVRSLAALMESHLNRRQVHSGAEVAAMIRKAIS